MNSQDFNISKLDLIPSLLILTLSVLIGILVNEYVQESLGKSSFFSSLMIMLALYSSRKLFLDQGVAIFLAGYIFTHIVFVVFFGGVLEHIFSPFMTVLAMLDYLLFIVGAKFFYGKL